MEEKEEAPGMCVHRANEGHSEKSAFCKLRREGL